VPGPKYGGQMKDPGRDVVSGKRKAFRDEPAWKVVVKEINIPIGKGESPRRYQSGDSEEGTWGHQREGRADQQLQASEKALRQKGHSKKVQSKGQGGGEETSQDRKKKRGSISGRVVGIGGGVQGQFLGDVEIPVGSRGKIKTWLY